MSAEHQGEQACRAPVRELRGGWAEVKQKRKWRTEYVVHYRTSSSSLILSFSHEVAAAALADALVDSKPIWAVDLRGSAIQFLESDSRLKYVGNNNEASVPVNRHRKRRNRFHLCGPSLSYKIYNGIATLELKEKDNDVTVAVDDEEFFSYLKDIVQGLSRRQSRTKSGVVSVRSRSVSGKAWDGREERSCCGCWFSFCGLRRGQSQEDPTTPLLKAQRRRYSISVRVNDRRRTTDDPRSLKHKDIEQQKVVKKTASFAAFDSENRLVMDHGRRQPAETSQPIGSGPRDHSSSERQKQINTTVQKPSKSSHSRKNDFSRGRIGHTSDSDSVSSLDDEVEVVEAHTLRRRTMSRHQFVDLLRDSELDTWWDSLMDKEAYYKSKRGLLVRRHSRAGYESLLNQETKLEAIWRAVAIPDREKDARKVLRVLCRKGIPDSRRRKVWTSVLGAAALLRSSPDFYDDALRLAFRFKDSTAEPFSQKLSSDSAVDSPAIAYSPSASPTGLPPTPSYGPALADIGKSRSLATEALGTVRNRRITMPPTFGGNLAFEYHFLTSTGQEAVKRVLAALALNRQISYCPALPTIASVVLTFMSEDEAYAVLHCLLNRCRRIAAGSFAQDETALTFSSHPSAKSEDMSSADVNIRGNGYHPGAKFDLTAGFRIIVKETKETLNLMMPNLLEHTKRYSLPLLETFARWISDLFFNFFPYQIFLRILDAYFIDGSRILYLVGIAFLRMNEATLVQVDDKELFMSRLQSAAKRVDASSLMKTAFTLVLPKEALTPMEFILKKGRLADADEETSIGVEDNELWKPSTGHGVYFLPKVDPPSEIVEFAEVERLWSWLPARLRICDASLVFRTSRDGYHLQTLYRACEEIGPFLMLIRAKAVADSTTDRLAQASRNGPRQLISPPSDRSIASTLSVADTASIVSRDETEYVIGLFGTEELKPSSQSFGSGDCFVFRLRPTTQHFNWAGLTESTNDPACRTFLSATRTSIHAGGGGDGFALFLDKDLHYGATRRSATYNNDPLVPNGTFACLSLEVYKFD